MKFMTTKEAAERLSVTDARIRQLILDGRLPAQKFGNMNMIREEDLKLVAERKTGRPPQEKPAAKAAKTGKGAKAMTQAARRELAEATQRRWKNQPTATGAKASKSGKAAKAKTK
jgi:excisionase family DNA binding protein